jgi:hypothetical protein
MHERLVNTLHTYGTSLNCIINLRSTAIEALVQKLHQVLMVIQPKSLRLSYILQLIVNPILDGIPKRKKYPWVFMCKHPHNQIQSLFCNLDFMNDNLEKQHLSFTLPIIITTNNFVKAK